MRLLKWTGQDQISLTSEIQDDKRPPYAILSHTWALEESEEVTFNEIETEEGRKKAGYKKIRLCAEQARRDGFEYFWIDTCCINKDSSAKLQEAITSMFRWYKEAKQCYVYLSDVSADQSRDRGSKLSIREENSIRHSRWFRRGWTLQELLAPRVVVFFSREWLPLGNKYELGTLLEVITSIPIAALQGQDLSEFSIDQRLRWAEQRRTTRKEEEAYCLLGIFGVIMTYNYGEGEHAFRRLEAEINKQPPEGKSTVGSQLNTSKYASALDSARDPLKGTCTWILKHEQFKRWYDRNENAFLWYTALPSYGKSIMAGFLANELRRESNVLCVHLLLSSSTLRAEHDRYVIGTILREVYQQDESIWQYLCRRFAPYDRRILQDIPMLWKILAECLARLKKKKVVIIIDNIESIDGANTTEVRQLLQRLEKLVVHESNHNVMVKIAVFCRPYHYLLPVDDFPSCRIATEDVHSTEHESMLSDLQKYLEASIRQITKVHRLEQTSQNLLVRSLQRVENPNFLWVRIITDLIVHVVGGTNDELLAIISNVPQDLKSAYELLLQRCGDHAEAWRIFSIVAAAERPLSLDATDIFLALDRSSQSNVQIQLLGKKRLSDRLWRVCGFALTTCDPKVSFAYPGLKEFLLCEIPTEELRLDNDQVGQRGIWENSIDVREARHSLGKLCVKRVLGNKPYWHTTHLPIGAKSSLDSASDYAERYWAVHIAMALQESDLKTCSKAIHSLIDMGLDLKRPDLNGKSLLHHALTPRYGDINLDLVRSIISLKGLTTHADCENLTCLHYAVIRESRELVQILLDAGFGIDTVVCRRDRFDSPLLEDSIREAPGSHVQSQSKGLSALHAVAYFGSLEMIKMLLKRGADATIQDEYGQTALHLAVSQDIEGERFLDGWHFANVPENFHEEHYDDAPEVAQRCLDKLRGDRLEIIDILSTPNCANVKDQKGQTALHVCHFSERSTAVDHVKLLLDRKFDSNCPNSQGCTPLSLAARAGDTESVKIMAQVPEDLMITDSLGRNALHHAASSGVSELVTFILEYAKGHRIEQSTDINGRHAIHYCFYDDHYMIFPKRDVLKILMENGVDCKLPDESGQDALAFYLTRFSLSFKTDILEILAPTCDVHYQDQKGMNLIHHLAHSLNDPEVATVVLLHENGVPITAVDQEGRNILHHAAIAGTVTEELLCFLDVEMRLDLYLQDYSGQTALSHAREQRERLKQRANKDEYRTDRYRTTVAAFRHYARKGTTESTTSVLPVHKKPWWEDIIMLCSWLSCFSGSRTSWRDCFQPDSPSCGWFAFPGLGIISFCLQILMLPFYQPSNVP